MRRALDRNVTVLVENDGLGREVVEVCEQFLIEVKFADLRSQSFQDTWKLHRSTKYARQRHSLAFLNNTGMSCMSCMSCPEMDLKWEMHHCSHHCVCFRGFFHGLAVSLRESLQALELHRAPLFLPVASTMSPGHGKDHAADMP